LGPTPKPADGFGGSTPKYQGERGLGVESPIFGSWMAKPQSTLSWKVLKIIGSLKSDQLLGRLIIWKRIEHIE
jgi:hypothetical protein